MRNKLMYLSIFAITLSFGACNKDFIFNEKEIVPETPRTLLLTASLPGEDPSTRVDLVQDGKNILLTWVVGDSIQLVFKQGGTELKDTVAVESISNEGKRAHFTVVIPSIIAAGSFDLYGVYGGGGLSGSNPTHAILSEFAEGATSLNIPWYNSPTNSFSSVQDRKDVMLYFSSKNVQTASPQVSVNFKHLGSLFSVTVMNTAATDLNGLDGCALVEVGGDGKWAYNTSSGGKNFDLVNEVFLETESGRDYIIFSGEYNSIASGSSITFWGWYPPLPNVNWPELKLDIIPQGGGVSLYETVNTHPARTQPLSAGNAYHFYAVFDGAQLKFNAGSITDSRDGNVYQTVAIGSQVWMSENLKYLPSVVSSSTGSETVPYYYVYDYDEVIDEDDAKTTENYIAYGVLYNWPAAISACPAGWHLPTDAEWTTLITYLGGETVAGGKLKEVGTDHWSSTNINITNQSGFTALPGGDRGGHGGHGYFEVIGDIGSWWTATVATSGAWHRGMWHGNTTVYKVDYDKSYGFSVRCVRD